MTHSECIIRVRIHTYARAHTETRKYKGTRASTHTLDHIIYDTQTHTFTQMHILIKHLRTPTLIHTYKIANKVFRYLYNYTFFNNSVIMFQSVTRIGSSLYHARQQVTFVNS